MGEIKEVKKFEIPFLSSINKFIKGEKIKKIIFPLGILGILLIFVSGSFNFKKTSDINKVQNTNSDEYIEKMQKKIESLISNINGVSKPQVLVTLENGSEIVYAKEEKKQKESSENKEKNELSKSKTTDDTQVKYITVKNSDGTEKALAVKELEPTVKGVVVVCKGGENKEVRKKITEAIKTAFGISEKKVCVTH